MLSASISDADGAKEVIARCQHQLPRLVRIFADKAYRTLQYWISWPKKWVLQIVGRLPDQVGFEVQPMRWLVERTFAWFGKYRRLSKDYEHYPHNSEAWIYIAMIHRMARQVFPCQHAESQYYTRI